MYEYVRLAGGSGYVDCPARMGLFEENGQAILIDTGGDKSAGRKLRQILDGNGYKLQAIYNTHYHADHVGGNAYLQKQTGCKVYAPPMETAFVRNPILEPALLIGGNPFRELHNKFLMAEPCDVEEQMELLPGWQVIPEPGHSPGMVGYLSPDGVAYIGDAVSSEETLDKYHVCYTWDPKAFLETLDKLEAGIDGVKWWVPAHAPVCEDIRPLAAKNRAKVLEIADRVAGLCQEPQIFEDILTGLFHLYNLTMNPQQYALLGSTLRGYLSWLQERGDLEGFVEDNRLLWRSV